MSVAVARRQRPGPARGAEEPDRRHADRRWDRIRFTGPQPPPGDSDPRPRHLHAVAAPEPMELPDPAGWAGTIVRAAVEVLQGQRPAAQLTRWLDAEIWNALNRRALLGLQVDGHPTRPQPVRIVRVHPCQITERIWECSVVVHDGERTRAAAVRLEVLRERWRATALSIG